MKKDKRLNVAPGALLLILLGMLILLAVYKRLTTAEEVEKAAVIVEHHAVRDSHSPVAVVAMVALFAYVTWTALRANRGGAKGMPPARESSPSDKKGESDTT
jgi:hypothetical protein